MGWKNCRKNNGDFGIEIWLIMRQEELQNLEQIIYPFFVLEKPLFSIIYKRFLKPKERVNPLTQNSMPTSCCITESKMFKRNK